MQIELLADHRDVIPTLAGWFRESWPEASEIRDPAAAFERACTRDRVPLALVALEDGEPVGTAALLERSVSSHASLSPWLAALYVRPDARHRGVATRLIAAITDRARALGFETLYIGVRDGQRFYEDLGWMLLGEGSADGEHVIVLGKDLSA